MKRITMRAWLIFFGAFVAIIAWDYGLRVSDGNIRTGGLNETLTLLILLPFAAYACLLLIRASRRLRSWPKRALFIGLQVALAFVVTQLIALAYVIGLRIDSF